LRDRAHDRNADRSRTGACDHRSLDRETDASHSHRREASQWVNGDGQRRDSRRGAAVRPARGELWDQTSKAWRPALSDETLKQAKPIVAVFKPAASPAWQATFVAIGQKDSADVDAFSAAVNGSPGYFVRALVKAKRGGIEETALSPASAPFTFVDPNANARFTTQFDTPTTKSNEAHKVRMLLKGDGLQPAGYLEIRAKPNFEVEIANCDPDGNVLAKVLLMASGEIRLTPAASARVVIDGDAETNRLLYAPAGGGAKRWLP
jgi:hypothetical protein